MRSHWLVRGGILVVGAALAVCGCTVDNNGLQAPHGDAATPDTRPVTDGRLGTGGDGSGGQIGLGAGGSLGGGGNLGTGGPTDGGGTGGVHGSGGLTAPDGGSTDGQTGTGGKRGTGGGGAGRGGNGGTNDTGGKGAAGAGGIAAAGGNAETGGRAAAGRGGNGGDGALGGRGGQPGGCGPSTCRNGCCDGNTCITASRHRLACGNGGIACAPCAACFQCSNAGTCDVDPTSNWTLSCQSATLTASKANGAAWDTLASGGPGGADPDPFCEFLLRDVGQRDTTVQMNTRTPVWNQSITPRDIRLTPNWLISHVGDWSVLVGDYDGIDNEAACQVFPTVSPSTFSTGTLNFSNNDSCTSLTLQLTCDE